VLQQLTQLGRTDSAVGAPIDFTSVQKYDFFAQCSVYVFYVYALTIMIIRISEVERGNHYQEKRLFEF